MKHAYIKQRLAILLVLVVYLPSVFFSTSADSWLDDDGFYGDLDGNATINASDALLCLQASVRLITLEEEQTIAADVDGNGSIDASDALYILQMSVGLISRFPAWSSQPVEGSTPPTSSSAATSLPENPEISDFGYAAVDPADYYCFTQLNDKQQDIYLALHRNAMAMTQGSFEVGPADTIDFSDIWLAYLAYTNDHAEVFWLDRGLRYSINSSSATVCFGMDGTGYLYTKSQRDAMQSELLNAVKQAFAECLLPGLTPSQRELRLHDWLAEHCVYHYPAVSDMDTYPEAFTSYGALVKGYAVCEGYSKAFELLCYYAGIECTLVTGTGGGGPHMWNAVRLEDGWYYTDTTWDAAQPAIHTFFNQTTDIMGLTHTPSPSFTQITQEEWISSDFNFALPQCNQTTYSYHRQFGVCTNSGRAAEELAADIAELINNGNDIVEIMVEDRVFQTMQDATDFLLPCLEDIALYLDSGRLPEYYSYSITPGANCIVVTFVF